MPALGFNAEAKARRKIFADSTHLFEGNFVPFPHGRAAQRLQTFMRISTSPRLQNGPHRIIHRVQVRGVGRPFLGTNEPRKIGLAPVLNFFCIVGWSRVLLKLPDSATEMAPGSRLCVRNHF